jgi:hypothetical protein
MTYQQRWMLSVALKRGYPSPFEAGDVAPETTAVTTTEPTLRTQLAGAASALRQFQTIVWVGGAAVALVGGVVGYAIGRSR